MPNGEKEGKIPNDRTKERKVVSRMFMSEYNHTIDEKGRVIVPAKYREQLGEKFTITIGLDGCLYIYTNEEIESKAETLMQLPEGPETRLFQREFLRNAVECEVDKQGRILIPNKLREHAALKKDVVFVGVINKIELWSKEKLDALQGEDDFNDFSEQLAKYNIRF